jgi:hypothetical protein
MVVIGPHSTGGTKKEMSRRRKREQERERERQRLSKVAAGAPPVHAHAHLSHTPHSYHKAYAYCSVPPFVNEEKASRR